MGLLLYINDIDTFVYNSNNNNMAKKKIFIESLPINSLTPNDENPRYIREDRFKELVKSIKEFPKMLEKRPVVYEKKGRKKVILGGNMRWRASNEAGLEEIWAIDGSDFTEEEREQFILKDNLNYGEWDHDLLSSQYDIEKLNDWGMSGIIGTIIGDKNKVSGEKEKEVNERFDLKNKCPQCGYEH